ncbi:MAG: cobalt ECF transporter T component CbiQ [Deltaproteobacteria bacterium]
MPCEHFANGSSPLHRADPRLKIVEAAAFAVMTASISGFVPQIFAFGVAAVLVFLARLDLRELVRRLLIVNVFIFLLALILPWSVPGQVFLSLGPFHASIEGARKAASIAVKCNAIVLANMALLSTSTVFSLAHALSHLRVPAKLVQLFFFSWRYLHVLEEEFETLMRALAARGFAPRSDLLTYRTYANLIGILFLRGFDRGERVHQAMLCRGFEGRYWLLTHFRYSSTDFVLAASIGAALVAVAVCEWFLPWSS